MKERSWNEINFGNFVRVLSMIAYICQVCEGLIRYAYEDNYRLSTLGTNYKYSFAKHNTAFEMIYRRQSKFETAYCFFNDISEATKV